MTTEGWLTYDQIKSVADKLWRQKKPVTAKTLYHEMGNRGSLATFQKYLMQWRLEVEELPEPPDEITQIVKKVWQRMERKTQVTLTQAQEQHINELHALQEQNSLIEAEKASLQEILSSVQATLAQAEISIQSVKNELAAEAQARLQAEVHVGQLEHRLVEQVRAYEKQTQLQQQLHDQALNLLQEQIKQLKQEHLQAIQQLQGLHEEQEKAWEEQRASLQCKLTLAEQQCQQQEETAKQTIHALNNQLIREQQHYQELLLTANTDNKALEQALAESNKQVAELQGEVRQLRLLAEERKNELSDAHAALFQLKQDVAQRKTKPKRLSE